MNYISNGFGKTKREKTYLHLRIGPARDFDDHVENGMRFIGVERDIMEGRDWHAILLDINAVIKGVWSSDLASSVLIRNVGVVALLGDGKRGHCWW